MQMQNKLKLSSLILPSIAILLPLLYVFYLIANAGELPTFDYWWIIKKFYSIDGFSLDPSHWFFNNNEHLVFIPSLVYAINIILTKGSNIGLSLFAVAFALGYLIILIKMLPPQIKENKLSHFCVILWLAFCCFTPAAVHNWMRGFSGVIWMSANLFVMASIFYLHKLGKNLENHPENNKKNQNQQLILLATSLGFALLGYLSYSTALAIWPVLCAVALVLRWPKFITWSYVGATTIIFIVFLLFYKTPNHHPQLSLNILDVIQYFFVYLGAIFSYDLALATIFGILGVSATIALIVYWLSPKGELIRTQWLPWLAVQCYILGTAFLASVSRSGADQEGFGVGQARSSRYASLPGLFWASLILLTILAIMEWQKNSQKKRLFLLPMGAIATLLTIAMYTVSAQAGEEIFFRAKYQPLVTLASQLGIKDPELIKERVGNRPEAFLSLQETLKAHGLVPFKKDIKQDNFCISINNQKLESSELITKPQDNLKGYFDTMTSFSPQASRGAGWVGDPDNKIKCLVILNQEQKVRGFGMTGFIRADVQKLLGPGYELSGWKGYFEVLPEDKSFQAYAMFKDGGKPVVLRNIQTIATPKIDRKPVGKEKEEVKPKVEEKKEQKKVERKKDRQRKNR